MMLLSVYTCVKGYSNVATYGNSQNPLPKSSGEDYQSDMCSFTAETLSWIKQIQASGPGLLFPPPAVSQPMIQTKNLAVHAENIPLSCR